jgi:hypothetical protein
MAARTPPGRLSARATSGGNSRHLGEPVRFRRVAPVVVAGRRCLRAGPHLHQPGPGRRDRGPHCRHQPERDRGRHDRRRSPRPGPVGQRRNALRRRRGHGHRLQHDDAQGDRQLPDTRPGLAGGPAERPAMGELPERFLHSGRGRRDQPGRPCGALGFRACGVDRLPSRNRGGYDRRRHRNSHNVR